MSDADRYIPGVPCWVDTTQPDPDAAARFYGELFGWRSEDRMPPGSAERYLVASVEDGAVGAIAGPAEPATWHTYVLVEDVDATARAAAEAGGTVVAEPFDAGPAGRLAIVADLEGAHLRLWQAGERAGAGAVNQHGALNFNDLHSRDVEAARAFYGAVFGWTTIELGDSWAWTLPGYGDHLERRQPGLRANMEQMGAPHGFEDVVATLRKADGDAPAQWAVTFGADDADAIAEQAERLGGTVLVAPFDAPWVRMTVLADPAGAVFTASQFVPPTVQDEAPADAAAAA